MSFVINLTWIQINFHLRKGNIVAFSDSMFNLARDEDGVVALYVFPLLPIPFIGNKIFFRIEKDYGWLENHYPYMKRSNVCIDTKMEQRPRPSGIYALIARVVKLLLKE